MRTVLAKPPYITHMPYTLWLFNIAMEDMEAMAHRNRSFTELNSMVIDFPWQTVSHIQMVCDFIGDGCAHKMLMGIEWH